MLFPLCMCKEYVGGKGEKEMAGVNMTLFFFFFFFQSLKGLSHYRKFPTSTKVFFFMLLINVKASTFITIFKNAFHELRG